MKYLIAFLLIPVQLFSCECGLEDFFLIMKKYCFVKADCIGSEIDLNVLSDPVPPEMIPYYNLGAMDAYYDCFHSMQDEDYDVLNQ